MPTLEIRAHKNESTLFGSLMFNVQTYELEKNGPGYTAHLPDNPMDDRISIHFRPGRLQAYIQFGWGMVYRFTVDVTDSDEFKVLEFKWMDNDWRIEYRFIYS